VKASQELQKVLNDRLISLRKKNEELEARKPPSSPEWGQERKLLEDKEAEIRQLREVIATLRKEEEHHHKKGGSKIKTLGRGKREKENKHLIKKDIITATREWDLNGRVKSAVNLYYNLVDQRLLLGEGENFMFLSEITKAIEETYHKMSSSSSNIQETCFFWLGYISSLLSLLQTSQEEESDRDAPIILKGLGYSPPHSSLSLLNELEKIAFHIFQNYLQNYLYFLIPIRTLIGEVESSSSSSQSTPGEGLCHLFGAEIDKMLAFHLPHSLILQFFCQIFSFLNDNLLFEMSSPKTTICTSQSGFNLKLGLSQITSWIHTMHDKFLSEKFNLLFLHCTKALSSLSMVLMTATNPSIFASLEEISETFNPLSNGEVKHLLRCYRPDEFSPDPLPREILTLFSSVEEEHFQVGHRNEVSLEKIKQLMKMSLE